MSYYPEDTGNYFRYLPISNEDMFWQLYATTVGRVLIRPGDAYPFEGEKHPPGYTLNWSSGRVLSEFQFVYIAQGAGRFRSFQGEFTISAGTMLLVVPGERHWYVPDEDTGWTEYWLGFKGEIPEKWLERKFIDRDNPIYHIGVSQSLISLFNQAIHYAEKEPVCMQQLIASLVPQIMARLQACRKNTDAIKQFDTLLERARAVFDENLYVKFDVEAITSSLKVNYNSLRDYFNGHTGLSPYQYFLQMKINKAKELLCQEDMSVKEVSFKLAFDNPYYFSRLFKKKTGVSPSRWNGAHVSNDLDLWSEEHET
jgi:AraC-like DNA-binding protein